MLSVLLLSSCTTTNSANRNRPSMDRAKFEAYGIEVNASEAQNGQCIYGPYQLQKFTTITPGKETGGGGMSFWDIFKKLHCKWQTMDGTQREEIVDMGQLLLPRYVEWEPIEGEKIYKDEPISFGNVEYKIVIKDKQFKITREYTILLYGEQLSSTSHKLNSRDIQQVIYERGH